MSLFVPGTFTGHSGRELHWKVECDALDDEDWRCLALMAVDLLPPFYDVRGIPSGGLLFAEALKEHRTPSAPTLVVADDVWTTGGSMREAAQEARVWSGDVVGVVAFSRSTEPIPDWCHAVVSVNAGVSP